MSDKALVKKNEDELIVKKLTSEPPKAFLHKHNNLDYVKVQYTKNLLDDLYPGWYWEIVSTTQVLNSMMTHGKLHLPDGRVFSGIGGAPIQCDKDTVLGMETIKNNAIQLAAPASNSYAFKNAVLNLGKAFGRDIGNEESELYNDEEAVEKKMSEIKARKAKQAKVIAEGGNVI